MSDRTVAAEHARVSLERLVTGSPAAVLRDGTPGSVDAWKGVTEGLLTSQCCAFHRNMEISTLYAWMYRSAPDDLKWAGMAAFASHHIRLALVPLRIYADRAGHVEGAGGGRLRRLLTDDVHTIRMTNNAIYDDIFWIHVAYAADDGGLERVRGLLGGDPGYAVLLAGFEAIDEGRRAEDPVRAAERTWAGNLLLLEHEQRVVVQPRFDRLSPLSARLVSMGSLTSFEVRDPRREASYFTSFVLNSLTTGLPAVVRAQRWPQMSRFDDRWHWLVTSVLPRFRRLDAERPLIEASLTRVVSSAQRQLLSPCR